MRADKQTVTRLLKTARGQLDGILAMVENDRYCVDISNQVMATQSILTKANKEILKAHIGGCVQEAFESGDPALLARLETVDFRADPEELVARCVAQKRDLVEQDEFDTGARQLLNLGHTLGHGVEACSGYTVSHGRAVAIGMTLVTRAAVAFGRCPAEVLPRLRRLLERYGLPDATAYSAQALYEKTLSDKKRSGDTISLVVPIAWGASQLVRIPVSELPAWIERGLGL